MTDQEIIATINKALAREFELDPDSLRPEATLYEDLELDSLDAVDMVIVLEEAFSFKIGTDEAMLRSIRTMQDLYDFVMAKRNEIAASLAGADART